MEEHDNEDIMKKNKYFEHTKCILDPNIHKFLYVFIKYLLCGKNYMSQAKYKLGKFIDKLNNDKFYKIRLGIEKDVLDKNKCDTETLKKLFIFLKKQNISLAYEIFENILIRIFSFAFVTGTDEFFGKYIYNNLRELRENENKFHEWVNEKILTSLFNENNIILKEAINRDKDLANQKNETEKKKQDTFRLFKESTFLAILYYLIKSKNIINKSIENPNLNETTTSNLSGDSTTIYEQLSILFYGSVIGLIKRDQPLIRSLAILISAYIYYQNRKSPLMKYSEAKDDLEISPFVFDISEAGINDLYTDTILAPLRIEPRITDIELNKNKFKDYGIFELYKLLMFNKSIKIISLSSCVTKTLSLNPFNDYFIPFDNFNVEELNLSANYFKSDVGTNLSKLITHLKGLKILTLSNNFLKSGLGFFFVTLKNLYRKNQSKLEELYLVNCDLDDISLYELGELLKSKFCKLKCLSLNENKIPSNLNFFKSLKKNRSLEEIYFYGCDINGEKTDEIERIISNTNLESLYLYFNKIHDFNQYIRIVYRTTLVKNEKEKMNNILINNPALFNLNMNNGDCYNQNYEKLKIMLEGFKNTNLSILDLSSVIIDPHIESNNENFNYYKGIMEILDYLKEKQDEYKRALRDIFESEVDIKKKEKSLKDIDKGELEKYDSDKDIQSIVKDEKSKNFLYIIEKLNDLNRLSLNKNKNEEIINYIYLKKAKNKLEENVNIKKLKKMIII